MVLYALDLQTVPWYPTLFSKSRLAISSSDDLLALLQAVLFRAIVADITTLCTFFMSITILFIGLQMTNVQRSII